MILNRPAAFLALILCLPGLVSGDSRDALTAADFFERPELPKQAHAELVEQRGADFKCEPLLGDRAPALDYRLK